MVGAGTVADAGTVSRVQIELTALGETLMRRDMLRFAANLAVPAEGLMAAGVIIRHAIEEQFDTEGAHASGGWAALADSTVAEKARQGLRPEILQATGRLKDSLTRKFDPENVEELEGPFAMRFGTRVKSKDGFSYPEAHQTGTKNMPARPPVALTEADKVEIMRAIQAATVRGIGAAA